MKISFKGVLETLKKMAGAVTNTESFKFALNTSLMTEPVILLVAVGESLLLYSQQATEPSQTLNIAPYLEASNESSRRAAEEFMNSTSGGCSVSCSYEPVYKYFEFDSAIFARGATASNRQAYGQEAEKARTVIEHHESAEAQHKFDQERGLIVRPAASM